MPRRKVRSSELSSLLQDLRDQGATEVRRAPSGLDGRVQVTWREEGDGLDGRGRRNAYLAERPWMGAMAVSIIGTVVAALIVAFLFLVLPAG